MNFRSRPQDAPDINLIPFIDILLVVIIFMVLTTTYAQFSALRIQLPQANAPRNPNDPLEMTVTINREGKFAINGVALEQEGVPALQMALAAVAKQKDTLVIIQADANSSHQSVVNVMDAARRAGLSRISFATQNVNQ